MLQKNWQDLIKPAKLNITAGRVAERTAIVVAEPGERGVGLTLGKGLRRVLRWSLQHSTSTPPGSPTTHFAI